MSTATLKAAQDAAQTFMTDVAGQITPEEMLAAHQRAAESGTSLSSGLPGFEDVPEEEGGSEGDSEWPTAFQPAVEAILVQHPELRSRFQIVQEDGWAEFIEAPIKHLPDGTYDHVSGLEQDRLWDKGTTYGDDEIGERVIDGHTWKVNTDPNLQEATVWCDGVEAGENLPFTFKFYLAFDLVELGLWPVPDFEAIWKARVRDAELAVAHHDRMVADAAAQRNRLEAAVQEAKLKLIRYSGPGKLSP